ncbi:MAG: sigma-70 family RNA polymerase sigma factor [Candidatus Pacebacteria bacterium]|nr:sigma-70 family RNA polymerase sigma factor [Candidatus Paceibacterota bacterium]
MEDSDLSIIEQALEGDTNAFEILVQRHLKLVYNFVYQLSGNADEANDITQEVFVKIWKNLKKFDPKQNFRTWIFSIARNTTIDYFRKKKSIPFGDMEIGEDTSFEDSLADDEMLPDEVFEQKEIGTFLEKTLQTLSLEERTIILLHDKEDLTFEEMGKILHKPMNTVKSQYRRAIINFRKHIIKPRHN